MHEFINANRHVKVVQPTIQKKSWINSDEENSKYSKNIMFENQWVIVLIQ
jgi:hypothetical protein